MTLRKLHDVDGWQEFVDSTQHLEPQSYLWGAQKFCHKVFAQLDAFESDERYIVWMDADVVVHAELTARFLKKLVKDHLCAYLGRNGCYTETGFIIYDTEHPDFELFKKRFASFYKEKTIFMLPYWIDCLAFDASIVDLQAKNLTPNVDGMVDVFSRSPLAQYMSHDKGNRKYRRGNEQVQRAV